MRISHPARRWAAICTMVTMAFLLGPSRFAQSEVTLTEKSVMIPTYAVGAPDPYPMFYTQESYQGAQKRVYPYALIDDLKHVREEKPWKLVSLENEYVRISILPEMGGRLFEALDKTNNYDFLYRQHVIKPALIGMLGAWISGGIEWCVFHHHRNTTFMPVDYSLAENADGSKTLWFGETERRHRMKWLIGITLYPGKSYFETTVKFFNRTAVPHSILYWANVAVHVNDDYQVIFPPSVNIATYHSKNDFTHWPISQERYRGYDYKGVDISWWKNSPVSNSFFAWDLQEDFMGGYDHGKQAGMVHVANHHVVTGAKLWEWGTGPSGRMWDKILTDEDGPYAELMVGAFSDNQPDYSWIKPYEVKTFKQHWYPVREIGGFKNANLNAVVNLERKSNSLALVGFNTPTKYARARALLRAGEKVFLDQTISISPDQPFKADVTVPADVKDTDLCALLLDEDGRELIRYQPVERKSDVPLPETVKTPPAPKDIATVEELYFTGLRIEQIHNPGINPMDYYQEALKRSRADSRTNTIVGINLIKRGLYKEAEEHLRRAIVQISDEYTRPGNTETIYNLGLALRAQGRLVEAYDQFHKATWDYAFRSAAYYQLAELSCLKRDYPTALEQIVESLSTNQRNTKAMNVKSIILRHMGRFDAAERMAAEALEFDPLDFLAQNELYWAAVQSGGTRGMKTLEQLRQAMRDDVYSYLELAMDYIHTGAWEEAIDVLNRPVEAKMPFASTYPLVFYTLGFAQAQNGNAEAAANSYRQASQMPSDYGFPYQLEFMGILKDALRVDPKDAKAHYYLGNLLFDIQPEEAIRHWEESRAIDGSFGLVHRNLGWAQYRVRQDIPKAIESYEKALACKELTPRLLMELDTLYEKGNIPPQRRYDALQPNHEVVRQRVESFTREIAVLLLVGKYDEAIDYLTNNYFHVREGDESIHDIYVDAHLLKGLQCMQEKQYAQALEHFQKASEYPENLSVGRPENDNRAPQVAYWTGRAHQALGNQTEAEKFFRSAAEQSDTQRWMETQYFQALSWDQLGEKDKAARIYERLISFGARRLGDQGQADFFAKFGEQETAQARKATGHFYQGLGYAGQGQMDKAKESFAQAVELNANHLWAQYELSALDR